MHELALAEAVLLTAEKAAKEQGFSRLCAFTVRLGELQQISRESFVFCIEQLRNERSVAIQNAEVRFEVEPARFVCRACNQPFALRDATPLDDHSAEAVHFLPELAHAYVRCPACGSADFHLTAGRGVSLVSLEGDRDARSY